MISKETLKKVYRSADILTCRLCGAVGDARHWKNSFKESNRAVLRSAEEIYGNLLPCTRSGEQQEHPCLKRYFRDK